MQGPVVEWRLGHVTVDLPCTICVCLHSIAKLPSGILIIWTMVFSMWTHTQQSSRDKTPKINCFSQGRQIKEWESPLSLLGLLDLRLSRLTSDPIGLSRQASRAVEPHWEYLTGGFGCLCSARTHKRGTQHKHAIPMLHAESLGTQHGA